MTGLDKWPPEIGIDPYYCDKWRVIYKGDCREILPQLSGISAVVTDPPYGLGFMGKEWDTFDHSQFGRKGTEGANDLKVKKNFSILPRYQSEGLYQFVFEWAELLLSTCLPGAPLLSFGGTRTFHRIACAIEDAGWQIRDTIMWVYGSGFPKSLDISKAIDKHGGKEVGWFGKWLRSWRAENNITQKEIAILFPSKTGGLTGCVANWELGFNMPTPEQFNLICKIFSLPFASIEEAEREVIGRYETDMGGLDGKRLGVSGGDITIPATPEAKLWEGYGTALKPAYEPIIVAMKPIDGTFANNALKHKVAGLNIDECRVPLNGDIIHAPQSNPMNRVGVVGTDLGITRSDVSVFQESQRLSVEKANSRGRFPANLILDGSQEVMELFPNTGGGGKPRQRDAKERMFGGKYRPEYEPYDDTRSGGGSAARFFYTAKASRSERDAGLGDLPLPARNNHPTVKPLKLMEYLCKLVKMPEYNLILDPFVGSGTTLLACGNLGIRSIGIELSEEYCEIAANRCAADTIARIQKGEY